MRNKQHIKRCPFKLWAKSGDATSAAPFPSMVVVYRGNSWLDNLLEV